MEVQGQRKLTVQDHNPVAVSETYVPQTLAGTRLDRALAQLYPDYSRSLLKLWLLGANILVNSLPAKPRQILQGGEHILLRPPQTSVLTAQPAAIDLDILYEDADVLVINKPAGLVVHPGAGNTEGTLVNALLHHEPQLATLPRAGIVHRLDKDTTGLMVVSRSLRAHTSLVQQLQSRAVKREYQAIVRGVPISGGTIEQPIGRHPSLRTRMAIVASGRPAVTHYQILSRFRAHAHVLARIETGRTHQIRVHLASVRHPIVGDPVYGGRLQIPRGVHEPLKNLLCDFKRQALHAWRLAFIHPATGTPCAWTAEPPSDMQILLAALHRDAQDMPPPGAQR